MIVVPTGTANIASVLAAFRRLGATPRVSEDRREVADASHVMLPGVGAFGASMSRLVELGLDGALRERIVAGRPTMAICVGHQLLFETSDESPGARGLGVVQGHVGRFAGDVRVPQFGWNLVQASEGSSLIEDGWAYFANSYPGHRGTRLDGGTGDPWRPLRGGDGARQRRRLPVPPRAVGRLWRGAPVALSGARLMLAARIIPCLDVSHGRVVKGVRFQGLRDAGDPAERARLYQDTGADEIVILDVSATPEGRGHQHETIRRVREVLSIPLTVGGGVRAVDDAWHLLEAGADKVSVNTAAVERPEILTGIAERFGRQCCVIAIDAARARRAVRGPGQGRARGDRHRRDRVGARGGAARGRRGAADLLGPRRHALGLRPGADRCGGRMRCTCR